jgi:hypothetical protein
LGHGSKALRSYSDQFRADKIPGDQRKRAILKNPSPPKPYGLGGGVGRGLGVGAILGVGEGLAVAVGVAETVLVGDGVDVGVVVTVGVGVTIAVGVGVGVEAPDFAQYLPPVLNKSIFAPPQTIISLSDSSQTAVSKYRASGALVVLVATQLSVPGLYLPPVFKAMLSLSPPHTIISLSVHTAV